MISFLLGGELMKYVMVYWSRFTHNKQIVEYLDEKLTDDGHEVNVFKTDEVDPTDLPDADVYVFSAAAEAFRVQKNMRVFMKRIEGLDGKKFAIINTHAMKKKSWLKGMNRILSKKGMVIIAEVDFRIGDGQKNGEGLLDGWQLKLDRFLEKIT